MGLLALGRAYCGALSAITAALTWAAWHQRALNVYLLALLTGLSLSMASGVFGRPSRVLALAILGALYAGVAFVINVSTSLVGDRSFGPGFAAVIVPVVEFAVSFAGLVLARRLLEQDVV